MLAAVDDQDVAGEGGRRHDESQRAHIYTARSSAQKTQRQLLGDLIDRAFGGSPAQLVMQALSANRASTEELTAIRQILDQLEETKS